MSKNYCIVKQSKIRLDQPDQESHADYTAEGFANLDSDEIKRNRWNCIYIHFDDIGSDSKLWKNIHTKCQEIGVKIFYFTGRQQSISAKVPDPDRNEEVPILAWGQIKDYLGQSDHPSHRPPVTLEYMPALSILCQGYLVAHAQYKDSDGKDWNDEDIAPARERMGWTDFMAKEGADRSLIKPSLGSKADLHQVRGAEWWRDVFGHLDFNDGLKKEWDGATVPIAVTSLLELMSQGAEIQPPSLVAQAYLAIADRLEGKRP